MSIKLKFLILINFLGNILSSSDVCPIKCVQQQQFLCIEDHLTSLELERKFRNGVKNYFSVCHLDTETNMGYKVHLDSSISNLELNQPTIAITVVQCSSSSNFFDTTLAARNFWSVPGCRLDYSLLLNLANNTLVPYLLEVYPKRLPTALDFKFKLENEYKLASVDGLLDELVSKVDASRQPNVIPSEDNEEYGQAHWPRWAIVLCVGCIALTIMAFLVGIHLSKRRTPLRSKGQQATKTKAKGHRTWGAGFSGGMWQSAGGAANV